MAESETPPEVAAILRQEVESGIAAQNGSIGEFGISSVEAEEIGENVTMAVFIHSFIHSLFVYFHFFVYMAFLSLCLSGFFFFVVIVDDNDNGKA